MNIVVLQSVRYDLIGYDRAINHDRHYVVYIGTPRQHGQIPPGLRCEKIVLDESRPMQEVVGEIIANLGRTIDRLLAIVEEELIPAARLRARFGIPGPTPAQAEKVRNKAVMKRCVAAAGLPTPCFTLLSDWLQGRGLPIADDAPVIIKPVDGASSIDVERFDCQRALAEALAKRSTGIALLDEDVERHTDRFEVEAFVSGRVVHVDGLARRGRLEIMVPSRYVGTALGFAHGEPFGSVQMCSSPALEQLVARILDAVEIRDGAFHLELIESRDGPVFLEIAHRVGGARVTETFERRTGIHLGVADIAMAVDPDHILSPDWHRQDYFAWFVVPAHQLVQPYCRITGHEWLRETGTVQTLNLLGEDKAVCQSVTYTESLLPLAGLLRADCPQALEDLLRQLFDGLVLEGLPRPVDRGA